MKRPHVISSESRPEAEVVRLLGAAKPVGVEVSAVVVFRILVQWTHAFIICSINVCNMQWQINQNITRITSAKTFSEPRHDFQIADSEGKFWPNQPCFPRD